MVMHYATQRFTDGIGMLGYNNISTVVSALPLIDRMRFGYSWASNVEGRCALGSMPLIAYLLNIIETV